MLAGMSERETLSEAKRAERIEAIERTIAKMKDAKAAGFRELDFDMTNWFSRNQAYECGTAACVAGWVVHANSNLEIPDLIDIGKGKNGNIPERARELLHISRAEAGRLFFAEASDLDELQFYNVKIEHAILVLEHLRETGEVAWAKAFSKPA